MHRSYQKSVASLAIAVLAAALIAGCGNSAKKVGTVSAGTYAGRVCSEAAAWLQDLHSGGETLNSQLADTTPARGKRDLESFIGLTVSDTATVVGALREAGAPDVANGQKIAAELIAAFEQAESSLTSRRSEVTRLATTNAKAFEAAAKQIGSSAQEVPLTLGTGLAAVNSPELDKAAAESAVCKSVGAHVKT